MGRILIVEDEKPLADSIADGLRSESHSVEVVYDGEIGFWAAKGANLDLVVLDIMLPKMSGLEICRRMRAEEINTPILFLTARDSTEDIVDGLDAGGTDYMKKPFAFQEFLARVRTLIRSQGARASAVIRVEDLDVDTTLRRVSRAGVLIPLQAKEYQLLEVLARKTGGVVSRAALTATLWEGDLDPDSNALEVHVSTLRKKIDGGHERKLIHTRRGMGYILE